MRSMMYRFTTIAATVAIVAIQLSVSVPVHATYPGVNGEIVYGTDRNVRAIMPDGSGDHRFSALGPFSSVSFSADGTKAAVVTYNGIGDRIVLINLANDTRSLV